MGRNKERERKGRLDKGSAGTKEFIGFGAFANTGSQKQDKTEPQLQWSPVYAGSDGQLSLVFKKISQKRDSVTKARALTELEAYFSSEQISRKEQVSALCHLLFVYHSKLSYDSSSAVRAAALSCLNVARSRVPKAYNTLWEQHPDLQGMVWCARMDPAAEVRAVAMDGPSCSQKGMCDYVLRTLGYGRARNMHDALFARKMDPGELSESEREQAEERFERIVGTALSGMGDFVQQYPEETSDKPYAEYFTDGLLWKGLVSSKSSIRRKTYTLVATLVGQAKSLIYGSTGLSALPKQLVNALAQEKEAVNVPPLLEALLLYITSFPSGEQTWSDVVDVSLLCKHVNKMLRKACYGASASVWGPSILPLIASLPTHYDDDQPFYFQKQLLSSMWQGRELAIGSGDTLSIGSAVAECSTFLLLRRQKNEIKPMDESIAKEIADFFLKALGQYLAISRVSPSEKDADREFGETLARDFCNMEISSKDRSDCAFFLARTYFWNDGVREIILNATGTGVNARVGRLIRCLLQEEGRVRPTESRAVHVTHLQPVFREKFHRVLSQYQSASGSVPDLDAYDIMIACLEFCGPRYIFGSSIDEAPQETTPSSGMEQFIMNDLLRWIVIHTSSLRTHQRLSGGDNILKRDFTLLRLCLPTISSPMRQKVLWESILKEIIAAKCDLDKLATGITVLMTGAGEESTREWGEILRSNEIMEQLAIQAGTDAAQQYRSHSLSLRDGGAYSDQESEASDEEGATKNSFFLMVCVGLAPCVNKMLVGARVIYEWIEAACPRERGKLADDYDHAGEVPNPLLETLLSLVSHGDCLSVEEAERVVVECWREGGRLWRGALNLLVDQPESPATEILGGGPSLNEKVVSDLSNESKESLLEISVYSSDNHAEILSICHCWSERASRLLQLFDSAQKAKRNTSIVSASSLSLTGLADVQLWENSITDMSDISAHHLYFCLVYLLERIEEPRDRLAILVEADGSSSSQLVVSMLFSLSVRESFAAHDVEPSFDRCAQFLSFLGGREQLPHLLVESWCQETVKVLATQMRSDSGQNSSKASRGVAVLSELVGLLCGRTQSTSDSNLFPQDIREGEVLWYVANKDNDEAREEVQIVKVHYDDFPQLYFTIRLLSEAEDTASTERQTVAERLRRQPSPVSNHSTGSGDLTVEEDSQRQALGKLIVEQLVQPFLSPIPFSSDRLTSVVAGECLNIVISQCGLPGKGGLGTTRYEVFKMVSSLESQIVDALRSPDAASVLVPMLLSMSSSMGYGRLSPASRKNFEILRFSPENSVTAILDSYAEIQEQADSSIDSAVLSWLTVSAFALTGGDLFERTVSLICTIGVRILLRHGESLEGPKRHQYLTDSLLVLRSVNDIRFIGHRLDQNKRNDTNMPEKELYSQLIEAFTSVWDSEVQRDLSYICLGNDNRQYGPIPSWHGPFSSFLETSLSKNRSHLANAARPFVDDLVEALFVPSKCWCAFRILDAVSGSGEQLHESESPICDETRRRLESWKEKLHVEEAEELEDDVINVNRWLPNRLMTELENWVEADTAVPEQEENFADIGRMLSWLCFLSFVDGAAAVDVTNRGSFSSYIYSCGAIDSILSSALLYANLEKERNSRSSSFSMDELLKDEDLLTQSRLSSLVLFRTVEVLPTLFKNWWTDECPKSLSNSVSQFVENKVAPEALKRELARIKNATNLGEMSVTGSCVSREVAASYVQDECQLSIVIQIPPNFPLRNVEVDGRKTLGIPEKRWKRWALQIRLMLNNQDGTILDALMLWKENVDKEFEGLEPCPVCYSVLSVKNHELPNLECKTCNNRFHSACLFKWFNSSGKSQCVLCQQPWSGTRVQ